MGLGTIKPIKYDFKIPVLVKVCIAKTPVLVSFSATRGAAVDFDKIVNFGWFLQWRPLAVTPPPLALEILTKTGFLAMQTLTSGLVFEF